MPYLSVVLVDLIVFTVRMILMGRTIIFIIAKQALIITIIQGRVFVLFQIWNLAYYSNLE